MKLGTLLSLPATALQTTAGVLKFAAGIGNRLASKVRQDAGSDVVWQRQTDVTGPITPAVSTTPAAPAVREQPGADAAPVDVAALAARPAPDVLAALEGLSALELADLYDHESRNRRRPAVLAGVEAAAAPPPAVRGDDPLPADDVRVPDELVYTTQTPRR